jgi:hypothetical protein
MGGIINGKKTRSPIMPTVYAHEASQLVYGISKTLGILTLVLFPLVFISVIDALHLGSLKNIFGDQSAENIIVILSISLLILVMILFRSVFHSRKILNRWAEVFERNSISAGINISMNRVDKQEAVRAIAESIEEIGGPLRGHISEGGDINNFINVQRGTLTFDVLFDKNIPRLSDDFKKILEDYGAIIIKLKKGKEIDNASVTIFVQELEQYKKELENHIGLAIIIGDSISNSAYDLVSDSKREVLGGIILVEKTMVES